jgi:hypothetical protein
MVGEVEVDAEVEVEAEGERWLWPAEVAPDRPRPTAPRAAYIGLGSGRGWGRGWG